MWVGRLCTNPTTRASSLEQCSQRPWPGDTSREKQEEVGPPPRPCSGPCWGQSAALQWKEARWSEWTGRLQTQTHRRGPHTLPVAEGLGT